MTASIGWEWTFYLIAIFAGVCFPFLFFFVPETAFRRPDHLNTDFEGDADRARVPRESGHSAANTSETLQESIEEDKETRTTTPEANGTARDSGIDDSSPPQKVSFAKSLLPFNGRKTDESFFKLFLRPFPLFLHPGILWVSLT